MDKMYSQNTSNWVIFLAAINAIISISAGAFAAHALDAILDEYASDIMATAADYQMYHALGLFGLGILLRMTNDPRLMPVAIIMFVGILLFSGSLYLLAFSGLKWLGMITPVGGICLLMAWFRLAHICITLKDNR